MTDNTQGQDPAASPRAGRRWLSAAMRNGRIRLLIAALVVVLLAFLFVPPFVNISRYKSRITQVISTSFGRPVRLSSVELRLLPWPGFVLTDLSVAEDAAYGAEPVLHANTVRANIRLFSLWRGKLEISSVKVDEASLNVVHAAPGRWNLDPLFRTAAVKNGVKRSLPYLEATNSRINFKSGIEKLPFSLVNTDLEFWQESSGDWRIRLRGEPARTDVALDEGDTGVVRLEARIGRAPELHLMPVHADLDWREAQLGQLSRLAIGADPGWRGDLTGELHLDGTPDTAKITTRLRATGVHRAEFAPASPLDFDANCAFVYHYSRRSLEGLECNSPLGGGHVRITGEVPGANASPNLTVEMDRVPVAAGLDTLRTMRNGLSQDLRAEGTISGKLTYAGQQSALGGSLTVDGFALSGGHLSQPLRAQHVVLEPVADGSGKAGEVAQALEGTVMLPMGGAAPLAVNVRLGLNGYEAMFSGPAAIVRARELAQTAGWAFGSSFDGLTGDPLTLDLVATGPWLASAAKTGAGQVVDSVTGTVTLKNASWQANYLVNPVQIAQATLSLYDAGMRWDPVAFSYGPVKGTASVTLPASCATAATGAASRQAEPCIPIPQFEAEFGELDTAAVQAAFLGAHEKVTMISRLLAQLHPTSAPPWPEFAGTVKAGSFVAGPVTLRQASATVKISGGSAEVSDLTASVLGGHVQGKGTVQWAAGDRKQPAYTLEGHFDKLAAADVGRLVGMRWSGGAFKADGKVDLSGFTDNDLAASAKGTLHFEWKHGRVAGDGAKSSLSRFDNWTGDAQIANGGATLEQNQVTAGRRRQVAEGAATFGAPPKVRLGIK